MSTQYNIIGLAIWENMLWPTRNTYILYIKSEYARWRGTGYRPPQNDDEDLSFLEEPNDTAATPHHGHFLDPNQFNKDDSDDEDDFGNFADFNHSSKEVFKEPEVDDKDVIILKECNFTIVVETTTSSWSSSTRHGVATARPSHRSMLSLSPSSSLTTLLSLRSTPLLKTNWQTSTTFRVSPSSSSSSMGSTSPTMAKEPNAIVTWIKKKIGPSVSNITTVEEAKRILTTKSKVVLGFLNSLVSIYMFGKATIQLKLLEGDSVGTVIAFYHILEGSSEGGKLVGRLPNYVNDEVKGDSHENIVSCR
ncbi:hypothetical protein JHK82_012215 [Glycine max]|nr:hypothetical protein JHK85_012553 [Glycine max]KAG5057223.1 hypothetical protein JHK86_012219 [Glycine max]KAG5154246.1 hypothetical protein JHK82_012215 [Glycine max]